MGIAYSATVCESPHSRMNKRSTTMLHLPLIFSVLAFFLDVAAFMLTVAVV